MNDSGSDSTNPQPVIIEAVPVGADEYRVLPVRPWVRFFARGLDLTIFGFFIGIIFAMVYPASVHDERSLSGLVILFLWFVVEPFILSTFGTTLGKYIFNIKITDVNHQKPTLRASYRRSFGVWIKGYAFGIPLISLITFYFAYSRLKNTGTTLWDKDQFIVYHGNIHFSRFLLAALIAILIFIGSLFILDRSTFFAEMKSTTIIHYQDKNSRFN